jgi:hypothetical protein
MNPVTVLVIFVAMFILLSGFYRDVIKSVRR